MLATLAYSPWYHYYSSKANKKQATIPNGQVAKRPKTALDDITLVHTPEPEAQAGPLGTPTPENLVDDLDNATSDPFPQVVEGIQQTGDKTRSRPRARRVTCKNPL